MKSAKDYKRAAYVIGEVRRRVLAVCEALDKGDYQTVGERRCTRRTTA